VTFSPVGAEKKLLRSFRSFAAKISVNPRSLRITSLSNQLVTDAVDGEQVFGSSPLSPSFFRSCTITWSSVRVVP
jgi:hypothetical protein